MKLEKDWISWKSEEHVGGNKNHTEQGRTIMVLFTSPRLLKNGPFSSHPRPSYSSLLPVYQTPALLIGSER